MGGVKTKQANSIFAGQNTSTASPLGSPTAESPEMKPVLTLEEWVTLHPQPSYGRKGRPIKQTNQLQIALPL
jgi:hypothetical protein